MADGDGSPDKIKNNINAEETPAEDDEPRENLGDHVSFQDDALRLGNQNTGTSGLDASKREENPFSLKHFIDSNYQNKGARPKVYCDGRPVSSVPHLEQGRILPEYSSSALPDFVQDHLLLEQCYLGGSSNNKYSSHLPDFTQSGNTNRINFEEVSVSNGRDVAVRLDLPVRPQADFPLDLPGCSSSNIGRSSVTSNEVGVSKSLPDFLADGAVRSQGTLPNTQSPEAESDAFRRELDLAHRQISEQTRQINILSHELEIAQNREHDLSKLVEQMEINLEKSNRKTSCAEVTIAKLKQDKALQKCEIDTLKRENNILSQGGTSSSNTSILHSHRLAQELRNAASTAENSLRQLLNGVDNLRAMAASLENTNQAKEKKDSISYLDEDTGPAL